jgi:hypothetical protein
MVAPAVGAQMMAPIPAGRQPEFDFTVTVVVVVALVELPAELPVAVAV